MRKGIALVVGGAECVHDDYKRALELFKPDRYYACNDMGAHLERLDVWCTLHPEQLEGWMAQRKARGLSGQFETVAPLTTEVGRHHEHKADRRVSYLWLPGTQVGGSPSSGGYAAKVALQDGYDAVLCGIPMRREDGHVIRKEPWQQRDSYIPGFEKCMPYFKDRVRSMSGWTMMVLGPPTPEWLAGTPESRPADPL